MADKPEKPERPLAQKRAGEVMQRRRLPPRRTGYQQRESRPRRAGQARQSFYQCDQVLPRFHGADGQQIWTSRVHVQTLCDPVARLERISDLKSSPHPRGHHADPVGRDAQDTPHIGGRRLGDDHDPLGARQRRWQEEPGDQVVAELHRLREEKRYQIVDRDGRRNAPGQPERKQKVGTPKQINAVGRGECWGVELQPERAHVHQHSPDANLKLTAGYVECDGPMRIQDKLVSSVQPRDCIE